MCGRFTLHHDREEIERRFEIEADARAVGAVTKGATSAVANASAVDRDAIDIRYNIAPTQDVLVVTENPQDHSRRLAAYHWGLIPSWAKDTASGSRMINARAETLTEKPSFRTALTRRRCLIPADGFYEWQIGEGKTKAPFHIRLKDGALFAFAGLWDEWQAPDGSPLRSCTIITTQPNSVTAQVHDRMPVILRSEDEALWLNPTHTNVADLTTLLLPYPAEAMEAFAVSRDVNRPVMNGPELILPMNPA
jgi:putative SOS response-associated peptidase YedK